MPRRKQPKKKRNDDDKNKNKKQWVQYHGQSSGGIRNIEGREGVRCNTPPGVWGHKGSLRTANRSNAVAFSGSESTGSFFSFWRTSSQCTLSSKKTWKSTLMQPPIPWVCCISSWWWRGRELTPDSQGSESRSGCAVQMRGSATPGRPQGKSVKILCTNKNKRDVMRERWAWKLLLVRVGAYFLSLYRAERRGIDHDPLTDVGIHPSLYCPMLAWYALLYRPTEECAESMGNRRNLWQCFVVIP